MTKNFLDLNSDVGEVRELIRDGTQDAIMDLVTSVNVACGGHAGDDATMESTLKAAKKRGLSVGAHPSYPDRAGFGRNRLDLSHEEIEKTVFDQINNLSRIATGLGISLSHVKPHGALYNVAAQDESVARAIARGVGRFNQKMGQKMGQKMRIVGLAGSLCLRIFEDEGFTAAGEAFADRAYESDGSLRARKMPGALITEPALAAAQAVAIAIRGKVPLEDGKTLNLRAETLCIHGDTPGAVEIARAIVISLKQESVVLRSLKALK